MDAIRDIITVRGLPAGREAGRFLAHGDGQRHLTRVRDDYELILVQRGRLPIAEDGVARDAAAGEALILHPGRRQRGTAAYAADLEFLWLHFTLPARGPALLALPKLSRPPRFDRACAAVRRYLDAQEAGECDRATAGALILLALSEIARTAPAPVGAGSPLAARADQEIARRFHHAELSTADIAEALGCNADHLGRAYRLARGRTVLDAIAHRRIADAQRLLLESGLGQGAIARQCGFTEERWFRKVFRRLAGTTPGAWRRMHARGHINTR
jgi:AraC-like DNA-binding protein